MVVQDGGLPEFDPPPLPRVSWRLTFRFVGIEVELVDWSEVRMLAPPSVGAPRRGGASSGSWMELRDANRQLLFFRILHDPFQTVTEVPTQDGTIEASHREPQSGEFFVIVPALPEARSASLWASPFDPERPMRPAEEVAAFDLRAPDDPKNPR